MFEIDLKIQKVITGVLKTNLALQEGEKFLIATDYPSTLDLKYKEPEILQRMFARNFLARFIEKIAKDKFPGVKTDFITYPCPWMHYPENLENLCSIIKDYDVCYVLSEFSIWTVFSSQEVKLLKKTRVAFSPGCDETIFRPHGPLDINSNKLERDVMKTYAKINKGKQVKIWNHMGTNLEIDLTKNKYEYMYESGIVNYPGKKSNLPAGEVLILYPKISGTYVVPAGWIEGLKSNLIIEIKNSEIIKIYQQGEDTWLKNNYFLVKYPNEITFISVGHNYQANNPFLIIEMIKMCGLVSIKINNRGLRELDSLNTKVFSGHFPSPNVYLELDGEEIFRNGQFML